MKRIWTGIWAAACALLIASAAHAQGPIGGGTPRISLESILSTVIFGAIGIIMAIAGFKLFDAVIHFNVEQEICEKNNIAAAILAGSMIIGICLIIAFAVL